MAESPDPRAPGTAPVVEPACYDVRSGPSLLGQALMWVGIVAGGVFVVAVIFFSGFFLGWSSGGHWGPDRDGWIRMGPGRMTGPGGMMGSGGMPGPGSPSGPATSTASPTPTLHS